MPHLVRLVPAHAHIFERTVCSGSSRAESCPRVPVVEEEQMVVPDAAAVGRVLPHCVERCADPLWVILTETPDTCMCRYDIYGGKGVTDG